MPQVVELKYPLLYSRKVDNYALHIQEVTHNQRTIQQDLF
jgi:hypothetical protein